MAVFRVERTSDYTVMSNYHLRDKRLSLKAKGLLSQMLSLPEDWDYPEGFEKYHFKAAILERNRFMVNHSSYALCYVDHDWGGAAKTYRLAVRQGLRIINLGELDNGKSHI